MQFSIAYPNIMDNTPNTEHMFADENHDFIKLFNGNANYNDETEIHNDLPYPTDDSYCMYYTPDEISQTIGNENNQLSIIRVRLTCVGRRCAAGRSFLRNRSAWSVWVVPFRLSSVGGLGYRNRTAVRGTIVWEMRCSRQTLSNGSVFRWFRRRCHQTRKIVAFQTI